MTSSPGRTPRGATADSCPPGRAAALPPDFPWRSAKVGDQHLAKLAVVYVRQSSPQQVLNHRESCERQYALADVAVALGWPAERVLVIDEDQGHSGKTAASRPGFQRLIAEVTMGHVGLIVGLEVSRLARSSTDWQQLFELCAVFQTLLADQEGVYDAHDPNDRMVLGLKGMMSEVELTTMRNRLERGKLHKAQRGALFTEVPVGYVRLPSGEVGLDPDEQARGLVRLVFAKFAELGSVYGVFRYLLDNGLRLGMRVRRGPRRGQLEWRRPALPTLYALFHNPTYAGAYAYGRRCQDPRRRAAGRSKTGQRMAPRSEWKVLLRDRLPAYIGWDQYLENEARMRQNHPADTSAGAPRPGAALLTGLVVCGRCGARLHVTYGKRGKPYYQCVRHLARGTERVCHGLQAGPVDELVAAQVLRAVTPAALELSRKAVADARQERQRLERHWQQRLERARYEAERAERQYQAVEPENRLVARTLERAWEEALQAEAGVREEYDRWLRAAAPPWGEAEAARIRALAEDIPALWQAPTTTAADRKEVVRCLVERVVVHVRPESELVAVTVHWQGGFTTEHEVARAVQRYEHLDGWARLLARIQELRRQGQTATQIAAVLNAEGYRTPKTRGAFTVHVVRKLVSQRGLANAKAGTEALGPGEWWLADLARELKLSPWKLRAWVIRGWLHGRQLTAEGPWVVWADREELRRLKKLRARSKRGAHAHPRELVTPKKRRTE